MSKFVKSKFKLKKLTLERVSKEWLFTNKNSYKKSTYQTYSYIIEKYILTSEIAHISIMNLNTAQLVYFSENLINKGLSTKTVNDIILILNSILRFVSANYSIEASLAPHIKEQKKEMRVLSILEQQQLENYLKSDMDNYKFGVLIALYTGIRIGELCALQWKDINNGYIIISKTMQRLKNDIGKSIVVIDSPKTFNSNRTIPIPSFLNSIIEQRRASPEKYVLSTQSLEFVEPRLMQIKFKKITSYCGFSDVTFHTLRHTFATRCVECDCDIKTLSEILGHADVNTTLNRYVHSSLELKQNNINKLQKFVV
ncbi:MAG: tyrosine-type recombinase/integrase [Eubacterium sp.]